MVRKNKSQSSILRLMSWRTIKSSWRQLIAIIFITFLATALYAGLSGNSASLQKRIDTIYDAGNMGDIWTTYYKYDEKDEAFIKGLPEVSEYTKRLTMEATQDGRKSTMLVSDNFVVSKPTSVVKGETEHSNGIYVDNIMFKTYGMKLGQETSYLISNFIKMDPNFSKYIPLLGSFVKDGGKNILLDDQLKITFVIDGTMAHPEGLEAGAYSPTVACLDVTAFKESLLNLMALNYSDALMQLIPSYLTFDASNQYVIKLNKNKDSKAVNAKIEEYFANKTESNLVVSLTYHNYPSNVVIQNELSQALQLTYVFPVIFFLVAILVILTSLSQIIYRSRSEIGIMKGLGMNKFELFRHYIFLGNCLVLIGSFFGLIFGPFFLPYVMEQKYVILYNLPPLMFAYPWIPALAMLLILIVVTGLLSYIILKKEINLKPVESLRPEPPHNFDKLSNKKTKKRKEKSKNRNLPLKMAWRNIRVKPMSALMCIIGSMGCTALLVAGFGIMDTINHGLDIDLHSKNTFDYIFTYGSGVGSQRDELEKYPEISDIDEFMTNMVSIKNDNKTIDVAMYSFEESPLNYDFLPTDFSEGIALPMEFFKQIGGKVGDKVEVILEGKNFSVTLAKPFVTMIHMEVYASINNFPGVTFVASRGQTKCDDKVNAAAFEKKIKDENPNITSLLSLADYEAHALEILSGVSLITTTVKAFAIFLACVSMYCLSYLNFVERKREIATLKVLGFKKFETAMTLVYETAILAFIGALLGLALGYPFMVLIMFINKTNLATYVYYLTAPSMIYSLLLCFGVAVIIGSVIGFLAHRVNAVEALKSVE